METTPDHPEREQAPVKVRALAPNMESLLSLAHFYAKDVDGFYTVVSSAYALLDNYKSEEGKQTLSELSATAMQRLEDIDDVSELVLMTARQKNEVVQRLTTSPERGQS